LKTTNKEELLISISSLLQEIRKFNFQKLISIMKESEQDISMIEDEDFILLLGSTGAGKSTTL
jgi:flagellar biosynthesis GTPase FlhF